jgi:hypothetical protein
MLSPWIRYPLLVLAVGMVLHGSARLAGGLMFGDVYACASIIVLLVAWTGACLLWGKKLAPWLKNPN